MNFQITVRLNVHGSASIVRYAVTSTQANLQTLVTKHSQCLSRSMSKISLFQELDWNDDSPLFTRSLDYPESSRRAHAPASCSDPENVVAIYGRALPSLRTEERPTGVLCSRFIMPVAEAVPAGSSVGRGSLPGTGVGYSTQPAAEFSLVAVVQ